MDIKNKRSKVLDNGVAKAPTADQLEYGEIAINYNETDPSIFIKTDNNNIIKIADTSNTAGVTKLIAGEGIALEPTSGVGDVTITSTMDGLEFSGDVDVTTAAIPAQVRSANALYVNTGAGEFSPEWAAVTGNADETTVANPGDFMIKDLGSSQADPWTHVPVGLPPASDGLWVEAGGALTPATLTNDVLVGGADATAATIQLNTDGSGTFAGSVYGKQVVTEWATALPRQGLLAASSDAMNFLVTSRGTFIGSNINSDSENSQDNTSNITLKADGSASFANKIEISAGGTNADGKSGITLTETGAVYSGRTSDANCFVARDTATDSNNAIIKADGSATFEGLLYTKEQLRAKTPSTGTSMIVGNLSDNPQAGTGRFIWVQGARYMYAGNNISNDIGAKVGIDAVDGKILVGNNLNGGSNIILNADGSATFAGTVTADTRTNNNFTSFYANCNSTSIDDAPIKILNGSNTTTSYLISGLGQNAVEVFNVRNDGSASFKNGDESILLSPNSDAPRIDFNNTDKPGAIVGSYSSHGLLLSTDAPNAWADVNGEPYIKMRVRSVEVAAIYKNKVNIGGTITDDPNISLNTDGSATFAGTVTAAKFDLEALSPLS